MADSTPSAAAFSCFKCPDEGAGQETMGSAARNRDQDPLYDNKVCPFINDVLEKLTLSQKIQVRQAL